MKLKEKEDEKNFESIFNNNQESQQKNRIDELSLEIVHDRVICDGCGLKPITGVRYKCAICNNFDLCQECEETIDHDHPFLKIKHPKLAPKVLITSIYEENEVKIFHDCKNVDTKEKVNKDEKGSNLNDIKDNDLVNIFEDCEKKDSKKIEDNIDEISEKLENLQLAEKMAEVLGISKENCVEYVKENKNVLVSIEDLINGYLNKLSFKN